MAATDDHPGSTRGRPVNTKLTPAIMEAVLALLAENGYAALTTAAVAKRAGVSTATLYRRWPSKRDLLLAAAAQIAETENADIDTGTTEGDLVELLAHKRRVLSGAVGATLVALVGEAAHDPELAAIVRHSVLEPTRDHLAAVLKRAEERDERRAGDASSAAHLIIGAILARAAFMGSDDATEILRDEDVSLLVQAITGAPSHGLPHAVPGR
ncbi:Transcriptional regulator, TetR-family [Corynebacterium glyciniphilum AJ 3170]|uniref:Transcriptional regulator, TetR-family n=1 Tax=Corynebacterium glyciniphilum AJ 3170 TaxID=1404245 RepID=X5DKF8_9CORY|nr:TetR/AcrR family transcriptional regulator [Corynebacterium glyciniphilum]AHW63598.1 Transcriptional regulator, TetR-family [Corynebacterium glyciniphilum AJ 3170]